MRGREMLGEGGGTRLPGEEGKERGGLEWGGAWWLHASTHAPRTLTRVRVWERSIANKVPCARRREACDVSARSESALAIHSRNRQV